MLIVFFLAALASGALTLWLTWSHGLLVALVAAAVVASAAVALFAVAFALFRSRAATGEATRPRGVLEIFERRQPR